ncbi:MAG: GNAT family N-acetyltransferase [Muribaculaceae bacterium]
MLQVFQITDCNDSMLQKVKSLYFSSFPDEERRDWCSIEDMIANNYNFFRLNVAVDENGDFIGFITTWTLPGAIYIEHFAVEDNKRGGGFGAKFFHAVTDSEDNVVLEVELPGSGDMADRRIAFYERNGMTALRDFHYVQPPYAPSLPSVPMMLMTKCQIPQLDNFVKHFHALVYNVK